MRKCTWLVGDSKGGGGGWGTGADKRLGERDARMRDMKRELDEEMGGEGVQNAGGGLRAGSGKGRAGSL